MKRVLGCAVACCLAGAWPAHAGWDPENDFPVDDVARREVNVDAKSPTADDHLVAIARAVDVNIIADATSGEGVDEKGAVVPEAVEGGPRVPEGRMSLSAALFVFTRAQKLHVKRTGEQTFLLWRPPHDATAVARQVVAQVNAFRKGKQAQQSAELAPLVNDFLRQSLGEKYLEPFNDAEAKGDAQGAEIKDADAKGVDVKLVCQRRCASGWLR